MLTEQEYSGSPKGPWLYRLYIHIGKYVDDLFPGRMNVRTYICSFLLQGLCLFAIFFLDNASIIPTVLSYVLLVLLFLWMYTCITRRYHDLANDYQKAYDEAMFKPLSEPSSHGSRIMYNGYVFEKGDKGTNRYGPQPKPEIDFAMIFGFVRK